MEASQFVLLLDKTAGRFDGAVKLLKNWAPSIVGGGAAAYGDYQVSGDPVESLALGIGTGALLHPTSRQKMRNYGLKSNAESLARPVGSPGHLTENAALWDGLIKGHTLGAAGKAGLFAAFRVPGILDNTNQATANLNSTLANVNKATGEMVEPSKDGSSAFSKLREGLGAIGNAGVSAGSDIADSAKAFSSASSSLSGLTNSLNDISSFVKGTPENPGLLTRAINSQEQLGKTFSDRAPYIAGGALGLAALKVYMDSVRQQKEDERDAKRLGYHKAALFEGDALSTGRPPKPPTQQPWSLTTSKGKSTIRNSNIPSKPISVRSVKLSSYAEDYVKLLLDLSDRRGA